MRTFTFTVNFDVDPGREGKIADLLFEAGCDDAMFGWLSDGSGSLDFDREAESLTNAVSSAIAQVRSTGAEVSKVSFPAELAEEVSGLAPARTAPELISEGVALLSGATGDPDEVVEVIRVFKICGPRRAVLEHLANAKGPGQWTQGQIDYVVVWGPVVPAPRPG